MAVSPRTIVGVGKVSSIILYQMHLNYKGFKA